MASYRPEHCAERQTEQTEYQTEQRMDINLDELYNERNVFVLLPEFLANNYGSCTGVYVLKAVAFGPNFLPRVVALGFHFLPYPAELYLPVALLFLQTKNSGKVSKQTIVSESVVKFSERRGELAPSSLSVRFHRAHSPMASLVLNDSSQLTSDSQHLEDPTLVTLSITKSCSRYASVNNYSSSMVSLVLTDSSQLTSNGQHLDAKLISGCRSGIEGNLGFNFDFDISKICTPLPNS
uniref:(California timema) hypothetical protein n=1 Tax=Timema californicum TaxID=61474 RepID=A0A7R9J553_TIMCA|nr:unnamed protein product [Timema californicum]